MTAQLNLAAIASTLTPEPVMSVLVFAMAWLVIYSFVLILDDNIGTYEVKP